MTGTAGTSSPSLLSVAPGEYPVNEIWANWVDDKLNCELPKKIFPAVPGEPAVPVQPLMMRVAILPDAQVAENELAKLRLCAPAPRIITELVFSVSVPKVSVKPPVFKVPPLSATLLVLAMRSAAPN